MILNIVAGWSLWSKDIIVLITSDSKAGPQAWVDAYHNEYSPSSVAPLPIKSGALQGVVVVDNALNHRFESLHIVYDGINGQLPNLDLFNTATAIGNGQMGIGVALQSMWSHSDTYKDRLRTMLRGMASQGLGHASGPHSSFIPYHVDAITLQAVGDGWQDEMAMGRCIESTFRSLNNLLEKFHQSFFFYLLMQPNRFVSIGTYLPSAMLVAVNFTIMAIALWIRSGRPTAPKIGSTTTEGEKKPEVEVIKQDGMIAIAPKQNLAILERHLFLPIALVVSSHFLGVIPLSIFNNATHEVRPISSFSYLATTNDITVTFGDYITFFLNQRFTPYPLCLPPTHNVFTNPPATPPPPMLFPPHSRHVPRHTRHPELLSRFPNWYPCSASLVRGPAFLDHQPFTDSLER